MVSKFRAAVAKQNLAIYSGAFNPCSDALPDASTMLDGLRSSHLRVA
jgi:hypothetical protein